MNLSIFNVFLKNRNFTSKIKRSKVTDYAALTVQAGFNFLLLQNSCADPESFVRGGPTLTPFFFGWWGKGGSKYYYKRANNGPSAKRHINGVSLACRWWPNIECWLCSFVIFRGSRPVLLRNPKFLRFFRGGVGTPCLPPLDPHMNLKASEYYHAMQQPLITDFPWHYEK